MKVFAIISVARPVDKDYVVIKTEKAFKQASKADDYFKGLAVKYAESVDTPYGPVPCVCERGVFEIDVEEDE